VPQISDFSPDQQSLLIALPYRVGYWVSVSDQSGGEESSVLETRALGEIITSYVEDYCKSEFAQRLLEQTLAHKIQWPVWHAGIDRVLDECRAAMDILTEKLEPKELHSFCLNLMEIGRTVAMAYAEEGAMQKPSPSTSSASLVETMTGWVLSLFGAADSTEEDYDTLDNLRISHTEREALTRIAESLAAGLQWKQAS
jgi:hypothetical protein